MNKVFIISFFLLNVTLSFSQDISTYRYGIRGNANISKCFEKNWTGTIRLRGIGQIGSGDFSGSRERLPNETLELFIWGSKRLKPNTKVAFGYTGSDFGGDLIHRFNQQYSWVTPLQHFTLGQRIALDETFGKSSIFRIRARYRINAQFPLSGQAVNDNELYLKVNNEYLGILRNGFDGAEVRLIPMLGMQLGNQNKIELGLDNRINNIFANPRDFQFWAVANWYLTLE